MDSNVQYKIKMKIHSYFMVKLFSPMKSGYLGHNCDIASSTIQ